MTTIARPRLIYYTSGLWPCGVASYQRNVALAMNEFAEVDTVKLPTDRVYGHNLRALFRQRRRYRDLAAQSANYTAVIIDYTDTFWNGSRLGENLFPLFARHLKSPAIVVLHEGPGRVDPADVEGSFPMKVLQRLTHLAVARWDTRTQDYNRFILTQLFGFTKYLVTHAARLAEAREMDLPPARIHVVPTPAYPLPEPNLTNAEVDARFGTQGKKVLVLLGFPQASKGFDRAIAVLPHLPGDVVIVQIGDADRSRVAVELLQAQAVQLGVQSRFLRTLYVSDAEMAAVLRQADVALAPFRSVNQSSSLGHLIAAELPIVASRIPGIEQLAIDGAGILFADCDDPQLFAAAILQILNDPETKNTLRTRNATYSQNHSFRSTAKRLVELATGPA